MRVADALAWAGCVFRERGWQHEVWSGADAQLLANVRFLAGYRRVALIEPVVETPASLAAGAVLTIAAAEVALRDVGVADPRRLLWSGRLRVDLQRPLTSDSDLPVSIPTVRDRIVQTAVKMVIEPIFEADFAECSFGVQAQALGARRASGLAR